MKVLRQNLMCQMKQAKIKDKTFYIKKALKEATIAARNGDIPVGALIVYRENLKNKKMCEIAKLASINDNDIIAKAYNRRNKDKNAISHAEILAIKKACKKIGDFRLEECVMYVTLEPCQMCAGAILQCRMKEVVIGAKSIKSGSCGSIIDILNNDKFNHKVKVTYEDNDECKKLLRDYFRGLRNGK